jgi:Zn-dependent protease with chaperone function
VFASLVALAIIFWAGYRWGVPWTAREIAERLPRAIESEIADQVLKSADGLFLEPTGMTAARRAALADTFAELRSAAGLPANVRLEFRKAKAWIGANAFALPGGVVVLTDQLVEGMKKEAHVIAVLAHELGHIERRHSMRMVLQNSIIGLVTMAVFGDASSVAGVAIALPTTLAHSGYSRDFEREADQFAFDLLRKTGRTPADFAAAMRTLKSLHMIEPETPRPAAPRETGGDMDPNASGAPPEVREAKNEPMSKREEKIAGYFSTHPDTDERIVAAEIAARK